eukprot:CAMPEP_0194356102 /NCGR_PEP_ID=MMETSP0174-20130528/3877_1 /TAXON_ID=216777 /ORGANISM="Proboscia alata, Strain PI-D3" /LENGTH=220 /DNA_ID=CAMNT_0039125611 /DNA_START=56 /DNA_END=718 /DNA_ORIENTATION=+
MNQFLLPLLASLSISYNGLTTVNAFTVPFGTSKPLLQTTGTTPPASALPRTSPTSTTSLSSSTEKYIPEWSTMEGTKLLDSRDKNLIPMPEHADDNFEFWMKVLEAYHKREGINEYGYLTDPELEKEVIGDIWMNDWLCSMRREMIKVTQCDPTTTLTDARKDRLDKYEFAWGQFYSVIPSKMNEEIRSRMYLDQGPTSPGGGLPDLPAGDTETDFFATE